ncbi:hypothetical protein Hanom_Chr12g01148151 [Helianthus anomalus]
MKTPRFMISTIHYHVIKCVRCTYMISTIHYHVILEFLNSLGEATCQGKAMPGTRTPISYGCCPA